MTGITSTYTSTSETDRIIGIVSADSHVNEPGDLWDTRLGKKHGARAPHIVKDAGPIKGDYFILEGLPPVHAGQGIGGGRTGKEFIDLMRNLDYKRDIPRAGFDPAERVKAMEADGMVAELLYPTVTARMYSLRDPELQRDCFRVYNDWIAEFCSYAPKKLAAVACISLYDVQEAVNEVDRCLKMGLKGLGIWMNTPPELPYTSPRYDPFWAAAQEADVPVSFHVVTGFQANPSLNPSSMFTLTLIQMARMTTDRTLPEFKFLPSANEFYAGGGGGGGGIEQTLRQIIFSGVLERFPRLKLVTAEVECDWIPMFLNRADRTQMLNQVAIPAPITMKPSEYFRRQVWSTYTDDDDAIMLRNELGVSKFMFGSDFPHQDGTYPFSPELLARFFKGVSDEDRTKMIRENCLGLYKWDIS